MNDVVAIRMGDDAFANRTHVHTHKHARRNTHTQHAIKPRGSGRYLENSVLLLPYPHKYTVSEVDLMLKKACSCMTTLDLRTHTHTRTHTSLFDNSIRLKKKAYPHS